MTISIKIQHKVGDKAVEVIPYDPYTGKLYDPTLINPESFEKEFVIYNQRSLIIREVEKVDPPQLNG